MTKNESTAVIFVNNYFNQNFTHFNSPVSQGTKPSSAAVHTAKSLAAEERRELEKIHADRARYTVDGFSKVLSEKALISLQHTPQVPYLQGYKDIRFPDFRRTEWVTQKQTNYLLVPRVVEECWLQ